MRQSSPTKVWLDIHKEAHHFSSAHFTIFSASKRENLHGHNYTVRARAQCDIEELGLCFDYNELKDLIEAVCTFLDETTLLPKSSPFLKFRNEEHYICVDFAEETMKFLPRDVTLLQVRNISVEELANWFVTQLTSKEEFQTLSITRLELTISSGPSESATAIWIQP